jgi:hypothetical protein
MAKYGKRPTIKRFRVKQTRPGRIVRKATLERKERKRSKRQERKMRPKRGLVR